MLGSGRRRGCCCSVQNRSAANIYTTSTTIHCSISWPAPSTRATPTERQHNSSHIPVQPLVKPTTQCRNMCISYATIQYTELAALQPPYKPTYEASRRGGRNKHSNTNRGHHHHQFGTGALPTSTLLVLRYTAAGRHKHSHTNRDHHHHHHQHHL
jgi:hypothetical protein